ncbi:MAG: hypothetical protein ABIJ40_05385 [Bacteroidota bacterium]
MTTIDATGNITHVKGDTLSLIFTEVKQDGVIINWTGYTMKFTVKESPSTTAVLSLTQASGINLTVNGQITITASAATMGAIAAMPYFYDLEVTDSAGAVDTWFNKKEFIILQDIA